MRRRLAALGAALIILALYLSLNPSASGILSGNLGTFGTEIVHDRNVVVPVAPRNYSFLEVALSPADSMSVSLVSNPGNVDVLLMNQGNFSQWSSANRGAYSTYPQSMLHVSNYSFVFASQEPAQNFYVVVVSHSTNQTTDVLAHAVVDRQSEVGFLLFPVVFGVAGIILMAYSFKGTSSKSKPGGTRPPAPETQVGTTAQGSEGTSFCGHCGAALGPGSDFCSSCGRSQL